MHSVVDLYKVLDNNVPKYTMSKPGFAATRKSGPASSHKLCVVLCAISLVLFTLSCREGHTGPISSVKSGFSVVCKPIQILGNTICTPVRGLGNVFTNLTANEQSLSELKEENQKLIAENVKLSEAQKTADRLQGLLEIKGTYQLESTGARIISGASSSWSDIVVIDKGSAQGMSVGMPVMDAGGVVGQICEVGISTSNVRLITDENSSVSAMIQSTRSQGMLQGSANSTLHLNLVKTDKEVSQGDIVVTSGLGGVYPKGLPLGKVSAVEKTPASLYYQITVAPLANVSNSEEVLVITALRDGQQATEEETKAADTTGSFPASQDKDVSKKDSNTKDAKTSDKATSQASSTGAGTKHNKKQSSQATSG